MYKFVLKRLLMLIPTLLGITIIVFCIMEMTPGSPGRIILGTLAKEEAVEKLNEELGYNRPFIVRLGDYILNALRGNFGSSYHSRKPVFTEIFARFPTTVKLAVLGVVSSAIIGIPLGILSAVKQYSIVDIVSTTGALFMAAIPGFWLGLMLILLFSLRLKLLPVSGIGTWAHYVLPTLTIAFPGSAGLLRMTRTTMLETIRQDYVRTARAKGATERKVIWGHALKNAMMPVVTSLGIRFGALLGGTVLVETVFALPGLGAFIITAIRQKDIPQVMAAIIFLAVLFCLILLLVDIAYAFIDPRIRSQYTK